VKRLLSALISVAFSLTVLAQDRGLEIRRASLPEMRVALVIGNAAYEAGPLLNPVNDARAITRALRDLGFEVTHKENADKATMENAIADFGGMTRGKSGVALFYYAGHGLQVDGRNYLVPVNARLSRENEVPLRTIGLDLVMLQLESGSGRTNVVILDACRNNPFARGFRSSSGGLALMDAPSGTLIAYATAPGSVADDGPGSNGVYTEELLRVMRTAGLQIEEVFKRVRAAVQQRTQDRQRPWEASSLVGNFYFVAPRPGVVTAAEPGAPDKSTATEKDAPPDKSAGKKEAPSDKRSASPSLTTRNTSRRVGENLWDWMIYIEADSSTLTSIQCVEYTLHPTFPEPVRTVCSAANNFGLSTQGWGTFEIKVRVLFKDGTERRLTHRLRFE
jgi:hypothetical protein